jgi:response regulator RpfG family c-di-GMP phosphodiesterase
MAYTLLIVDDEVFILDALRAVFTREGYRTLTATSGEEALKILEKVDVDVVISDEMMPGIRGIDFLLEVKHKYPEVIRIVLTAFAEINTLLSAINKAEAHRLILKPYENDVLLQTVGELIERQENARRHGRALEVYIKEADFAFKAVKIMCGMARSNREKYTRLLDLTRDYIKACSLSLMILYPESNELVVQAATNVRLLGLKRSLHENAISTWVVREGKPFRNSEGVENLGRFVCHNQTLSKYKSSACLSIPVMGDKSIVGVYNVADPKDGKITARTENTASYLMRWVGAMIEPGPDGTAC